MPAKLITTIKNIDIKVANQTYRQIIKVFYQYLQNIDTSENYQNGLLKILIRYAEHIGDNTTCLHILTFENVGNIINLSKFIVIFVMFMACISNFIKTN